MVNEVEWKWGGARELTFKGNKTHTHAREMAKKERSYNNSEGLSHRDTPEKWNTEGPHDRTKECSEAPLEWKRWLSAMAREKKKCRATAGVL
jgi:hypothetical protein